MTNFEKPPAPEVVLSTVGLSGGDPTIDVDLVELNRVLEYLKRINAAPLSCIRWRLHGDEVAVSEEEISDWNFVGLSNVYFAKDRIFPRVAR